MAEQASRFDAVGLDVGTGDGRFVRRMAREHPTRLAIGVDANAAGLREVSRRSRANPGNALFGRLAVEQAPGALAGIADILTVLLPWGSLLRAVALPDPAALARLHGLCRPGAELRVVFGYGGADRATVGGLGLPPPDPPALAARYREAGFAVTVRALPRDELAALPTTWARKLASSASDRCFVELTGHGRPNFSRTRP